MLYRYFLCENVATFFIVIKTDIDAVRGTCIFCNNFRGNENCLSQKHELEHSLTSIGDI